MQFQEVLEQARHVVERVGAGRMPRHEHSLPGGEVCVQIPADRRDPRTQFGDLVVALRCVSQLPKRFDLFQERRDRLLEFEQVERHDVNGGRE